MNHVMRIFFVFALVCLSASTAFAQSSNIIAGQDSSRRVITTAVPFLMIAPDARSGAMGDAGAAISPDANANHWNIGKLAFIDNDYGASLAYTPWLGKVFNDMAIIYLTGYYKIDELQAVAASMRYFDLGEITFTDNNGNIIRPYNPQEFSFDVSYSRKLSERLGIGVTTRFIHSNLAGDGNVNSFDTRPGRSIAADLGLYYNTNPNATSHEPGLAFAAVISNIGNKITYLSDADERFIPTNLRLGSAYTHQMDPYNSITIALDLNKLMVPTPPVYEYENGRIATDNNGDYVIARGDDPNRSLINGMFTSFADAPDGFSEELREVTVSTGIEYWYNELFAARAGYFYEHAQKGGRQYFTLGLGLRYQLFNLDFAYLIPQEQQHPLAETLRFTLGVNFDRPPQATSLGQ